MSARRFWHDFRNLFLKKIKRKLYIASGSPPPPPHGHFHYYIPHVYKPLVYFVTVKIKRFFGRFTSEKFSFRRHVWNLSDPLATEKRKQITTTWLNQTNFDVLLTVHLSIFILVINQLDARHGTATYRCDGTRGCIIQFWPPDDENMVLETCRGMK